MVWPSGSSEWKTWPTSKSAISPLPLSAFFCAALKSPGSKLGRMSESSAAIGLASASSGAPPPKCFASSLPMKDQVTASTMPREASARRASDTRFWASVSTGFSTVASRRGKGVEGTRSSPPMRVISSTRSALPSMSGRQEGGITFAKRSSELKLKPSRLKVVSAAMSSMSRPVRRFVSLNGKSIVRRWSGICAGERDPRSLSAADLEHHARRELEPRKRECGIDAALETIARIRVDAELAAGLGDIERIPKRRFDQHIGRALVAARGLSAHDAADQFDALLVGDDHHALVEGVGLAVEREKRLALYGAAHA